MGEMQVGVEGTGGPDFLGLDPAGAERGGFHEIRGLAPLKVERDVLEELGLVAFDREVVMGLPVVDQIGGERALSQQGIGRDVLALNLEVWGQACIGE